MWTTVCIDDDNDDDDGGGGNDDDDGYVESTSNRKNQRSYTGQAGSSDND